jgi:hypothetical protein
MSVQTLSIDELADGATEFGAAPADTAPWALRLLAVAAVCLGVAALAAATFVLSYSAIRAVALQAGITPRLARGYPLLLDAMLVIVLAAVLALRGAGLPSRLLAWVTLLLVMAVAAGADALHTAGRSMPHQAAAITAAVLPFVLVLVAFMLLLVMLRHARLRRLRDTVDSVSVPGAPSALARPAEAQPAATTGPSHAIVQHAYAAPVEHGSAVASGPGYGRGVQTSEHALAELAMDADPAADDPSTDEGVSEPAIGTTPYPADALAAGWYDDDADQELEDGSEYVSALTAEAAEAADGAYAGPDDDDGPVFHRLFSAPTPVIEAETTEADATQAKASEAGTTEAEATEADGTEAKASEAETTEAETTEVKGAPSG